MQPHQIIKQTHNTSKISKTNDKSWSCLNLEDWEGTVSLPEQPAFPKPAGSRTTEETLTLYKVKRFPKITVQQRTTNKDEKSHKTNSHLFGDGWVL